MKCFFDQAVEWKVIEKSPVLMKKPAEEANEVIIEDDNIDTWDKNSDNVVWDSSMIYTAISNIKDEMLCLMVHIAAVQSCRNGEVCGLTWDYIDFQRGAMKVHQTLQRVNEEDFKKVSKEDVYFVFPKKVPSSTTFLILKAPKNKGSVRWMYLTKPILEALKIRKEQIEKNQLYFGDEYKDYNLVFCLDDGTPIEPHLCEKKFLKWQERNKYLNLPEIHFHRLRHSATTLLMQVSDNDKGTVKSVTGHATDQMVNHYNHPQTKMQKQLVDKVTQMLYSQNESSVSETETLELTEILSAIQKNPLLMQEIKTAITL